MPPACVSVETVLDFELRNREHFRPWSPALSDDVFTVAATRAMLVAKQNAMDAGTELRWWFSLRDMPERIIGSISFSNIVYGAFLSCHCGYKTDVAMQGMGYCSEALAKGIHIMFGSIGLHRIEANIIPRNTASVQVVRKLGFVNEGHSPMYLRIDGRWQGHDHYVLLNTALHQPTDG
ncbi:MAG: GNAT family N-acetyltransferase [Candidatus Kapabacteria bacterium]|nr:GNAT family N-acetyltransferase [Candidatus Kapabacteria bacterium]